MTTRLLIVNFGPDHLLVRTYAKDNEPGDDSMRLGAATFIPPQEARNFWVHQGEGLLVDEDKLGTFAPLAVKP